MRQKILGRIHRGQNGITGLETAIILIAFVVVAAVFAYTVLSAGLFTTQKSQEAVYSGIQAAQSSLNLKGDIIGKAEQTGTSGNVSQITFAVTNFIGGAPIDFTHPTADSGTGRAASGSNNVVTISYVDADQSVNDLYWSLIRLGGADADDILEVGETFQITVGDDAHGAGGAGNLIDALSIHKLDANRTFTILVRTGQGSVLSFEKTMPGIIQSVMVLR